MQCCTAERSSVQDSKRLSRVACVVDCVVDGVWSKPRTELDDVRGESGGVGEVKWDGGYEKGRVRSSRSPQNCSDDEVDMSLRWEVEGRYGERAKRVLL